MQLAAKRGLPGSISESIRRNLADAGRLWTVKGRPDVLGHLCLPADFDDEMSRFLAQVAYVGGGLQGFIDVQEFNRKQEALQAAATASLRRQRGAKV